MIATKYPNRDALYASYTIYRDAMRRFIINCLKKNCDHPEKLISKALTRDPVDPIRLSDEIEATEAIDIDNFPHIVRHFWDSPVFLSKEFGTDRVVWNESELIKDGRPHWAHPGTKDTEPDATLKLLLLIRDTLDKINAPDEKREVEVIRDRLFSQDIQELLEAKSNQLETAEADLAELKENLATTQQQLAIAEAGKTVAEEQLADISDIVAAESFRESSDDRETDDALDQKLDSQSVQKPAEVPSTLEVGQWVKGIVKNITPFGAFVDLDWGDGLIRIPELTWKRINDPSDVVSIGDEVKVKVINIDQKTEKGKTRIDLRLKSNPWEDSDVEEKYPIDSKVQGTVTNTTDYGVFLKLEEGLIPN